MKKIWSIKNANIATLSDNGLITEKAVGTSIITSNLVDDTTTYAADDITLYISKKSNDYIIYDNGAMNTNNLLYQHYIYPSGYTAEFINTSDHLFLSSYGVGYNGCHNGVCTTNTIDTTGYSYLKATLTMTINASNRNNLMIGINTSKPSYDNVYIDGFSLNSNITEKTTYSFDLSKYQGSYYITMQTWVSYSDYNPTTASIYKLWLE